MRESEGQWVHTVHWRQPSVDFPRFQSELFWTQTSLGMTNFSAGWTGWSLNCLFVFDVIMWFRPGGDLAYSKVMWFWWSISIFGKILVIGYSSYQIITVLTCNRTSNIIVLNCENSYRTGTTLQVEVDDPQPVTVTLLQTILIIIIILLLGDFLGCRRPYSIPVVQRTSSKLYGWTGTIWFYPKWGLYLLWALSFTTTILFSIELIFIIFFLDLDRWNTFIMSPTLPAWVHSSWIVVLDR